MQTVEGSPEEINILNPQLWWPNGLGAKPLYQVDVFLKKGEDVLDIWSGRIGLRTMTVRREKDQWGESFAHEVNGKTVFAMGADYFLRTICRDVLIQSEPESFWKR